MLLLPTAMAAVPLEDCYLPSLPPLLPLTACSGSPAGAGSATGAERSHTQRSSCHCSKRGQGSCSRGDGAQDLPAGGGSSPAGRACCQHCKTSRAAWQAGGTQRPAALAHLAQRGCRGGPPGRRFARVCRDEAAVALSRVEYLELVLVGITNLLRLLAGLVLESCPPCLPFSLKDAWIYLMTSPWAC